jgi:RNA polymerase sigma-70 factor (ECF subfamily)
VDCITSELLDQAASGDMAASETVYRQAAGFVYNVALRVMGSPDAAADVTQDVFITLFAELKNFRRESSFKTWVYRVTVNHALNARRNQARHTSRSVPLEPLADLLPDTVSVEADAEKASAHAAALQLLATLPDDQRVCMVLRNCDGLSYQEIAAVMKTNINTVRTWLHRARTALLQKCGKEMVRDEVC